MTLTPLRQDDPRLRHSSASLTRQELRSRAQQIEIDALIDFVYGANELNKEGIERVGRKPKTVGLSAPQVGIMKKISVVDLSIGRPGYHDIYVLINPIIIWKSKTQVKRVEGCVNFSEIWGETIRSRGIRVMAMDRSGNELQLSLSGWPATLMEHEIDHLNGRLFVDRLADPKRAHIVTTQDFGVYRKTKPEQWSKVVDVTGMTKSLE